MKSRLKIVMIGASLASGGAERVLQLLSRGFLSRGHEGTSAAGQVIEAAVTNAGSLDRNKIRKALYALDVQIVIGRYRVDRFGIPIKHRPIVIQWLGGKKKIVWPVEHLSTPD